MAELRAAGLYDGQHFPGAPAYDDLVIERRVCVFRQVHPTRLPGFASASLTSSAPGLHKTAATS
eukprot:CAMPEP_0175634408 /NCGR_PEP_ID=MMETSP0097-20121207/1154_1 /TAXON_ID=311494 /ORGANISM="Alexandrium monilatum, Strain CCMP3105" /LENGTH=63 /DNA_ID=CAMNT_0016940001 /DNA_START=533 /DNA_END=721 /DNA_ORIENTATION=-